MSHTSTLKTNITDVEALRRALIHCGIKANQIEISDSPIVARGYHNDAFHANLVVHKVAGSFGSDIGWEKTKDGTYAVHIDGYHYGTHQHYDETWTNRLNTRYNIEKSKMALDAAGVEYTETVDEKKRVQLKARFKSAEQSRFVRMGR
jgi:hypothetical protein